MEKGDLDFTKPKNWSDGKTPEEIARIQEKVDALNARGKALLAEQSDPKNLDFTQSSKEAAKKDKQKAEELLARIKVMSDEDHTAFDNALKASGDRIDRYGGLH